MPRKKNSGIRLRKIKIKNFKGIDFFEQDFPEPRMKHDPDIFIMGSKNGLGKTSILESCALLLVASAGGRMERAIGRLTDLDFPIDLPDLLIRSGEDKAIIEGTFMQGRESFFLRLSLSKFGKLSLDGDIKKFKAVWERTDSTSMEFVERFITSLIGFSPEPLLLPPLMYFHSYRKVREGNPDLGMMVEERPLRRPTRYRPRFRSSISVFKLELLRSMMSQADLFEDFEDMEKETDVSLEKLNSLLEEYAGGKITKLRPSPDSSIDFRITPTGGGESFTFDGLSSGQKEIISTLYLIWRHTKNNPGIILIDEPELHLNHEWHRLFMEQLYKLAPDNQYIVATHSRDVFSSVPKDHSILLEPSPATAK